METGRVVTEHKTNYRVIADGTEYIATVRGSFFETHEFPKVGDYVHFTVVSEDKAVIEDVLPRTSTIVRRAVESEEVQVVVANVDVVVIVMGLDGDYNLSRLERYLLLATQSGVPAVVILNKSDIVDDIHIYIDEVESAVQNVPVHAVSAKSGQGMDVLLQYLLPGKTAVLLGSSGAGKSTITNWLLSEAAQAVNEVRADDSRGRHTTTARQLFALPSGGFLIDTPGMRELGVVETSEADENEVFVVIDGLAENCRFSNCDHEKSLGCAVLSAIEESVITRRQLQNYQKLQRERAFSESKQDTELSWQQKQKTKQLHKKYKKIIDGKRFEREL